MSREIGLWDCESGWVAELPEPLRMALHNKNPALLRNRDKEEAEVTCFGDWFFW
ncbi:MAG: hypothetical protein VX278_06080 [Myxococcota bacterium]|nr:hypothetical protein [Myxococcota bacterium]